MAGKASYTVELDTTGAPKISQAFAETATAAEGAADRSEKAYDRVGAAAEKAEKQAAEARARAQAMFEQAFGGGTASAPAQAASTGSAPVALARPPVVQNTSALIDQRRNQAMAQRVMDQLDPASKLQRDYNAEIDRTRGLLDRNLISQQQHDAYVVKLKRDLTESTNALREHGGMLGLNRSQYITAQSAVLRFSDSVISGASPLRAIALEAHKVVEVLSLDEGGMAGGLSKVSALFDVAILGIGGMTVAMAAGAVAAFQYSAQMEHMEAAATGFGRTSQLTGNQLKDIALNSAEAGRMSVGAAQDIETAILQQTRTSASALEQAIPVTRKFADAMGIDLKKASEDLGKALADPAKGADELASKYGYLSQAQVEEIHQMMEQNNLIGAQQALLQGLGGSLDKAGDHVLALTKLWQGLTATISNGWTNIGSAINHAVGSYTDAEKLKNLQDKIFDEQRQLGGDSGPSNRARSILEAQLKKDQEDFAKMASGSQHQLDGGRNNQLGSEARDIAGKYAVGSVQPKLETLRQDLSKLEEAQHAGQHVDQETLDALHHAIRTFLTPEQQRVAIAQATADLRRAAPHSAARQQAGQRLADAKTAGQVISEGAAHDISDARGEAALGHGKTGEGHAESLARQASAMEVAAKASLALGDAYLISGAAALKAEAYRKAATDATRRGIDIDAQAERQLNLMVAEQVANSAKTVRSSEDETAARNRVIDAVRAGQIPANDMQQALTRENSLRPLLTLQAVAHGDALKHLTDIIKAQTQAMADSEASQKRMTAQQAINTANDNARSDRARGARAGLRDPAAIAWSAAADKGAAQGLSAVDTVGVANADANAAKAKQDADTAVWLADSQHRSAMQQSLLDLQIRYANTKDGDDNDEIARQKLIIELDQQKLNLNSAQIDDELARRKTIKDTTDELGRQKSAYQQLRDDGANALDRLFSPDGVQNWGNTLRSVIRQVLTDLEKMALLNPLENMLFGGNRATLGSGAGGALGSLFGSLFGGNGGVSVDTGATMSALDQIPLAQLPAYAVGTDSAPGGMALVGEQGPELVNLPRGAGVMTASESRSTLQSASGGDTYHMPITINAQGAGPREVDTLRVELQQLRSDIPSMAVRANSDARTRRVAV